MLDRTLNDVPTELRRRCYPLETPAYNKASALKREHLHLDEAKAHIVDAFSASQRSLDASVAISTGSARAPRRTARISGSLSVRPLVTRFRKLESAHRRDAVLGAGAPLEQRQMRCYQLTNWRFS